MNQTNFGRPGAILGTQADKLRLSLPQWIIVSELTLDWTQVKDLYSWPFHNTQKWEKAKLTAPFCASDFELLLCDGNPLQLKMPVLWCFSTHTFVRRADEFHNSVLACCTFSIVSLIGSLVRGENAAVAAVSSRARTR